MPRPTFAQLSIGTLTTVAGAIALLAVSGAMGIVEIAVLVAFAVALGTLTTALLMTTAAQRRSVPRPAPTPPAQPQPNPAARRPEYARQT